ncbi:TrlF family AAA-like ATPase [Ferrimonas aestuarii]|uniref:Histidinol-phosphatase n=1 Tax=Ferrimonas aestuarii TaxID=2569539 RepID=A0A4U1BLW1_9GAMM|nr:histidinol-phosphatase [Ferrimonas aestuarii]TKB51815.1 histidinol-phosphatase [Ferrimonas aestuarii]
MTDTLFQHGSEWVRADFHLHTRKDKQFKYQGEDDRFIADYVDGLTAAEIRVGAITNHNKFDLAEFKALRKRARKQQVHLLPGVELSVGDGNNGIHTLVLFSDEWLEGGDHINAFLTGTFQGKTPEQYEHEDGRSAESLNQTIRRLEESHKDYFLVFAHVENKSGLWNELGGGRLMELGNDPWFKRRTLGFQQVRTRNKLNQTGVPCAAKVKQHLDDWYPAEVEGSDPKQISEIGKGKKSYLKIGEFSFDAIKFALADHQARVSKDPQPYKHSYIRKISFEGAGALGGSSIQFSPELNTLIGIRGSGKSSLLEAIRYALNIQFGKKATDKEYKENLVQHQLGSGGKIIVDAVSTRGQTYQVSRILGQAPDVLMNDQIQQGVAIQETVLRNPIYFGQKDLSSTGEGFEKDLIDKLMGDAITPVQEKVKIQRQAVLEAIRQIKALKQDRTQLHAWKQKKQNAEHQLKFYQEHGVEEKLQKQLNFDQDERKLRDAIDSAKGFSTALGELITDHQQDLTALQAYVSKENADFFAEFSGLYAQVVTQLNNLSSAEQATIPAIEAIQQKFEQFQYAKRQLKEEFAAIERELAQQLQQGGNYSIRTDEFKRLKTQVAQADKAIQFLEKSDDRHAELRQTLTDALEQLEVLYRSEFELIEERLADVNKESDALQIKATYKIDKTAMLAHMQEQFRGSRLQGSTLQGLVEQYADFAEMRNNWQELTKSLNSAETFTKFFEDNLEALLTYQVPNKYLIEYHNQPLQHHSLGQRASALMLFILGQQDNDVVIIDQPEDDLDNQTIYHEVITLVRRLKPQTQFIFATHNANIPVLGDSEQVITCAYIGKNGSNGIIQTESGSIDNKAMQEHIVTIMEGGKEAFEKRKQVYEAWKH